MKIVTVVGARPNFMKAAPLIREMRRYPDVEARLIHTGQHYDANMAGRFFEDLQLPAPDVSLEVGSGSHAYQTAEVMKRLEPVLEAARPDMLVVVGDVNSTLAAALTAAKLTIPVAHVEAGLRSFDRTMPEELNRLLTDALSSHLFVTEESGRLNLLREGIEPAKIHFVGNVMIDALDQQAPRWHQSAILSRLGVERRRYGVVTLHRPATVDEPGTLLGVLDALRAVARQLPLVFPVHPRTRRRLEAAVGDVEIGESGAPGEPAKGMCWVEPLGYLDFVALVSRAAMVLTDSGGLQEETTALGVPCLTLRDRTERPVTVTHGTNRIVGTAPAAIVEAAFRALEGPPATCRRPYLWDGRAAKRIVAILRGDAPATADPGEPGTSDDGRRAV